MRKYFVSRSPLMPEHETREVRRFIKKYNEYRDSLTFNKICIDLGFFKKIITISNIFIYSEDDTAYEFFSGKPLGTIAENPYYYSDRSHTRPSRYYIKSDNYGYFSLVEYPLDSFTKSIEDYMPHIKKIKPVMEQYLVAMQSSHAEHVQLLKSSEQQKELDKLKNREAISVVESLLNNRK